MKLKEIIKNIRCQLLGNANIEIKEIQCDSKKIQNSDLFVCLKGKNYDSHEFVAEAMQKGAAAVLCERRLDYPITQIVVEDTRLALSVAAANYYDNPSKQLKIIGVVGTNGKTTTAFLLNKMFRKAGCKTALLGTLDYDIRGAKYPSALTTPDPLELHSLMRQMVDNKVEYLFMEVSAHSIFYKKVYGIIFKAIIFTNCTQDHLDFFVTMEEYKKVKKSFFSLNSGLLAVVNADDNLGKEIINSCKMPVISYGIKKPADIFAIDIVSNASGLEFVVNIFDIVKKLSTSMRGTFNVYNILAACTVAAYFGIPISIIENVLAFDSNVPGRFNIINHNGYSIVIDYAHTEDGLFNLLSSARDLCANNRLITVFGCGGNRDSDKRAKMGSIAAKLSDYVIITNDNPRFEEEESIAYQIESGVISETINYEIILDRKRAIEKAIQIAGEKDIIVIAGKGAEDYMEVKGEKIVYNDLDTLVNLIAVTK